jgi:hypothetical protein
MKRLAMVLAVLGFLGFAGSVLADCGSCEGKDKNRIEEPQQ